MPPPPTPTRSLRAFTPALILLGFALLINYLDRANLSVAAPLLKIQFSLSPSQLGILLAAFFATYTAMQFVVGWLVDRFSVNRILAAGFLLWSAATAGTGLVQGFGLLLAMRLLLGIGESVAVPASCKILGGHLPEHYRGFAGGAMMAAMRCGNAVGTLGAGLLIAKFGWRFMFIGIGALSLLWLPAWLKWMPRGTEREAAQAVSAGPRLLDIMRLRSFWGASLGHFCCNYYFYFLITWLPTYLVLARHVSLARMTTLATLYFTVEAASSIASGWVQDFFIRKGFTLDVVRKTAMTLGFSIAAVATLGTALAGDRTYAFYLMAAGVGGGATTPGIFAFCQTIAGPQVVGRWYGLQNGFANFAGVVGPALTGLVVQKTAGFFGAFAITSLLCIVGILAWVFFVGKLQPVPWPSEELAPVAAPPLGA